MKNGRFGKFAMVGCLGTALQLTTLALMGKYLHFGAVAATLVSVELAILHNFCWHERYTWEDRGKESAAIRLARFHLANGLVSLCGNTLITDWLVTRFHAPTVAAAVVAIGICAIANFALTDRWVYQKD